MKPHRALLANFIFGLFLFGCDTSGTDAGSGLKKEKFRVGSSEFSIPIGSDGYVKSGENGANWGFDPQMWAQTVGAVGGGGSSPFAVVGSSFLPNGEVFDVLHKVRLNKIATTGGEAFQSSDPIYKYAPVYFFNKDMPGYVQCPTVSTKGKEPDMERCMIHIVKDGVHHSFFLTAQQVPLAAETARIFLAAVTVK